MDVICGVVLLELQDESGMEAAVSGVFSLEPLDEGLGCLPQGEKGFFDRLQPVSHLGVHAMVRVFDRFGCTGREALVTGDDLKLGAVEADLVLGCLQDKDFGYIAVGNGVEVGFKLDEPIGAADSVGHLGAIVGVLGQRLQGALFLLQEEFDHDPSRGFMNTAVALFLEPPPGLGPQMLKVFKLTSVQEISFDVLEGSLDFSFCPGPPNGYRSALIVGDEGDEGRIVDGATGLKAHDNGFFPIVEAVAGNAAKKIKGILVTPDQGVEVPMHREIDVVPAREGQNVGKTKHRCLAVPGEADRIRAPIHLPLESGFRLEAHDRGSLWPKPHGPKAVPQDGDAPLIAFFPQFFKEALARDVGKPVQKSPNPR